MPGLFDELKALLKSILLWVYFFLGFLVFFFAFGPKKIQVLGNFLILPWPTINSFSVKLFKVFKQNLLPSEVQVIVINPLNAFLAQIVIALSLAFIVTFPLLLYRIIKFLTPALYEREKKAVFKVLVPATLLFIGGCVFTYFILIPPTFKILYLFARNLGATPFFTAYEFVTLTLMMLLAVGIMFQIPIFMVMLTRLGFVDPRFWKKNSKYIFTGFLVFSAIITPDGSGITMLMLFLPLVALYFLGYIFAGKKS